MQKSDVAFKPVVQQQLVDVLGGHAFALNIVTPRDLITPDGIDVASGAVHDQTAPIVVQEEESGVGLLVVLDTELYERLTKARKAVDEPLDDAVVSELTKHREFNVRESVNRFEFSHPPSQLPADESALPGSPLFRRPGHIATLLRRLTFVLLWPPTSAPPPAQITKAVMSRMKITFIWERELGHLSLSSTTRFRS
jgi:hypothetical protein